VATDALRTNGVRLARTRLGAVIVPTAANRAVAADGALEVLPGQGGVVLGIRLGDPALARKGDHVEPGVSLGHLDIAANRAIQILSCVGNPVEIVDGPGSGARGMVYGKHGAVLAALPQQALALVSPGDHVAIEACGAGLAIDGRSEVSCLSLSPELAEHWLGGPDEEGRLLVPVVAELPAEAAAAGIGMPSQRFNMDLHSDQPPMAELCRGLRFGDLVAVHDQDHRFGRRYRRGWIAVGVICHGRTIAGGHGLGFMTLLTGPGGHLRLLVSDRANVARLMGHWQEL
jgi:Domain of unknown function (DUF4438)